MRKVILAVSVIFLLGGCSTVGSGVELVSGAAAATGMIGKGTAKVIGKSAKVVKRTVSRKKKK
ncbi:MAG: hypothetical protein COA85_03425 [Robiginitomaculum sp.]|nr:MAG: hypothetical protein COA85_03425 [Robiginitomaculum sp.]